MNACLQINMAPLDVRHVSQILPHQMRVLGGQFAEVQFTVDSHHSRGSRYATADHAEKLAALRRYLARVCHEYPHACVVDVDYSAEALSTVARAFTGGDFIPKKAWDGSPFHAYLFAILKARCDYVFHTDCDMLYGGGSQHWVNEAIDVLQGNSNVLACYPLGGPPREDGRVAKENATWADGWLVGHATVGSDLQRLAYSYADVSTRAFILDKRRFLSGELHIPLVRPKLRSMVRRLLSKSARYRAVNDCLHLLMILLDRRRTLAANIAASAPFSKPLDGIGAFLARRAPYLALEDCLSILAVTEGYRYIGFLGSGDGLWSLHPPQRSERFYAELANLIRCVESDDLPERQRGDFNVSSTMLDWCRDGRRASCASSGVSP